MSNINRYSKDHIPRQCNKCITRPKLVQSGFSNPDWKCPVCDALYGEIIQTESPSIEQLDEIQEYEYYW